MIWDRFHWDFFVWGGWTSPNTCLVDYFNSNWRPNKNLGFTLFPLMFWRHIHFFNEEFGLDNKRIAIGIGIFSIFWDY